MPTTNQKWLIGCGAGCLIFVLALAGLGVGGAFFLRGMIRDVEETDSARRALDERLGAPRDFCPDPDGRVRPERMETFLRVREIMAPTRAELERTLSELSDEERGWRALGKLGDFNDLISQTMEFDARRSRVLLEEGMGLGEYKYLYALVFYCWLGKSPADGPPFVIVGETEAGPRDEFDAEEDRRSMILSSLNGLLRRQLRNQLEVLPAEPEPGDETLALWRARLEAEIEALESEHYRLAWIEDLPSTLEESFRPYRERLEESYSPMCNSTEMGYGWMG